LAPAGSAEVQSRFAERGDVARNPKRKLEPGATERPRDVTRWETSGGAAGLERDWPALASIDTSKRNRTF
jgi:hypothetical protein